MCCTRPGHGLEGDFTARGRAFSGRIGQRVAAKGVTVLTMAPCPIGAVRSTWTKGHAQRNVLIEDGILQAICKISERAPDGRPHWQRTAQATRTFPPRMTNTYAGAAPPRNSRQHQKAVRHQLCGGQVDIPVAGFFSASQAYCGKRQDSLPVKGATIVGWATVAEEDHHDRQRHARQWCRYLWQRGQRCLGRASPPARDGLTVAAPPDAVGGQQRPTTGLLSQSFAAISSFLRGLADEDSRELRETLSDLSQGMEAVLQARRARQDVALLLPLVQQLNESAQAHQVRLSNLGPAWQVMYEFAAYQRTLLGLRGSLQAWQRALQVRSRTEARLFQQFEQRAWRTLGEGLLLVDMYEQGGHLHSDAPEPPSRPLWLQRLRQWLHG